MQERTSFREYYPSLINNLFRNPLFSCLSHVVNLSNVDVMSHITKIAAVETTTTIWEYDPNLPDNRMLGGNLDVIAAVRTMAIKVRRVKGYGCTVD